MADSCVMGRIKYWDIGIDYFYSEKRNFSLNY